MSNHTDPKPEATAPITDIYDWYYDRYTAQHPEWTEGELHVAAENSATRYAR